MSQDWDRWADCPNCGYRTKVTVQKGIEVKQAVNFPCIQCGAPLHLQDDEPAGAPQVGVIPPADPAKHLPVKPGGPGGSLSEPVISMMSIEHVALADAQDAAEGAMTSELKEGVVIGVRAAIEALEGMGLVPRGAIAR